MLKKTCRPRYFRGVPSDRKRSSVRTDDPASRERARDVLHRELDRGIDPEIAVRLALRVSEECVEALLVHADAAVSLDEARQRIRRAVETATHVLGERALREGRGKLGAEPEGLDYLHALAALARVQTAEDRAEQAVQTLHGVLEMDPSDPVVVRLDLLLLLLALARDEEAEELVNRHASETRVNWLFARALVRRRRALDEASLARAGEALDLAMSKFPAAALELVEAADGIDGGRHTIDPLLVDAFRDTEGGLDWVRTRRAASLTPSPTPSPRPTPSVAPGSLADSLADRRFSALEFVEEAFEVEGPRREALAQKALEIWPDAADAWRALATVTHSADERIACLKKAVAASHRVLGRAATAAASALPDDEDGRRALIARRDLCLAYRAAERPEQAEAEERRLLVEDPNDTTHTAVEFAARLLIEGRDPEAAPLVEAHAEDASPDWSWLLVLLRRRAGDRVASAFALSDASLCAPLVGEFLRFGRTPPRRDDDVHDASWTEAIAVAARIRPAWASNPDALAWLRTQRPPPKDSSRRAPPDRGG